MTLDIRGLAPLLQVFDMPHPFIFTATSLASKL